MYESHYNLYKTESDMNWVSYPLSSFYNSFGDLCKDHVVSVDEA